MKFTQNEINQLSTWFPSNRAPMYRTVEDFRTFGATDTATWIAALDWQQADTDRVLGVPMGVYTLTGWTTYITTIPLVLIGAQQAPSIVTGPTGVDFIDARESVVVTDITFTDWDIAFSLNATADYDIISFERVAFVDSISGVVCAALSINVSLSVLRVDSCSFIDLTGSAMTYLGSVAATTVHRCTFENVVTRAIQIGRDINTSVVNPDTASNYTSAEIVALQDKWQRTMVTNNVVKGMVSDGDTTIIAIIVYGQYATITGNIVTELVSTATTKENDAIYTKCREALIAGNIVAGVSGGSAQYCINVKGRSVTGSPAGVQGYGVTVVDNLVDCDSTAGTGIRLQNERVRVQNNTVRNPTFAGIYVSSGALEEDPDDPSSIGYSDLKIAENHLFGIGTGTTYGINCTTVGSRVTLFRNEIQSFTTGIRMTAIVGTPHSHTLDRNIITDCLTHGILIDYSVPVSNVRLIGNVVRGLAAASGASYGLYVAPSGTVDNLVLQHNRISNIASASGGAGINIAPAARTTNLRLLANTVHNVAPAAGNGTGIQVAPSAIMRNIELRGNGITDINPAVGTGTGIFITPTAVITKLMIDENPVDYVNVPIPPVLTAAVAAGAVTGVTVVDGGSHFTSTPTVSFSGGGGTGATATATVASGAITVITVTAGGSGYATAPTVVLAGGNTGSSSGYGIRLSGTAADQVWVDDTYITNVKTNTLLLSTAPTNRHGRLKGTVAWNPAACAVGATVTTTVTVTGAAIGDLVYPPTFIEGTPSGNFLSGVYFTGVIYAADTVTVIMHNAGAASRDLANGTVYVEVQKA